MPLDLARPLNDFYTQTFSTDLLDFTCHTCGRVIAFTMSASELDIFMDLVSHLREAHAVPGTVAPWQEG